MNVTINNVRIVSNVEGFLAKHQPSSLSSINKGEKSERVSYVLDATFHTSVGDARFDVGMLRVSKNGSVAFLRYHAEAHNVFKACDEMTEDERAEFYDKCDDMLMPSRLCDEIDDMSEEDIVDLCHKTISILW